VLVGDRIIAFNDAGLVWFRKLPGLAGATLSADGKVLASVGSAVWALDAKGAETALFALTDEPFVTPPVLSDDGRLLVASARRLYALERAP
jgi:outer membrane protein assembly factor BamB